MFPTSTIVADLDDVAELVDRVQVAVPSASPAGEMLAAVSEQVDRAATLLATDRVATSRLSLMLARVAIMRARDVHAHVEELAWSDEDRVHVRRTGSLLVWVDAVLAGRLGRT